MLGHGDVDADRVPTITWVTLGLAGAVFAAAAWLHWTPAKRPPSPAGLGPTSPAEPAEKATASAPTEPKAAPPPELRDSSLDIAPLLLDAESRSRLWDGDATLVTITTLIGPSGPLEPVEFQFSVPRSGRLPGSPLKGERLTIRYKGGRAEQKPENGKTVGYSAPAPNCPLDVAARKLPASALASNYRLAVLYSYSKKESRPLWLFTEASGTLHRVDGNSCAVLIR